MLLSSLLKVFAGSDVARSSFDFSLKASAEAGCRFEKFLHLVSENALDFLHRYGLELRIFETQALDEVVCRELLLLDKVAVIKVLGFVDFDFENVGFSEHLERKLEAIFSDLFSLCSEHGLESAKTAVANCHNHLLDHFVDFFVSFHFTILLFVVLYVHNIRKLHRKSNSKLHKLRKIYKKYLNFENFDNFY